MPKAYNVLLIGSGAREHAIAWKISQSKYLNNLYIAPGNPGTAMCGINLNIMPNDIPSIQRTIWEKDIDILVVGPEEPLVNGIADEILSDKVLKDVMVIGPVKAGAMLEGSKAYAKAFMQKYNIPTAKYQKFQKHQLHEALHFVQTLSAPYVIKADGLAAGKGVIIAENYEEAKKTIEEMFLGKFGAASETIVIEEFLKGIEVSYFILCNGEQYVLLPDAKDYKRIGDNDTGRNTGGMGSVSPALAVSTKEFTQKVVEKIIEPTLYGLRAENINYCGFIFFGLMSVDGDPYLIEYNCRLGDPETESIMIRIDSDILELFEHTWNKKLTNYQLQVSEQCAATVILASHGYPDKFEKGFEIQIDKDKIQSHVFHAGTLIKNNTLITNGGRVMAISSLGKTVEEALNKSYQSINYIHFKNKYFRRDIGKDVIQMSLNLHS